LRKRRCLGKGYWGQQTRSMVNLGASLEHKRETLRFEGKGSYSAKLHPQASESIKGRASMERKKRLIDAGNLPPSRWETFADAMRGGGEGEVRRSGCEEKGKSYADPRRRSVEEQKSYKTDDKLPRGERSEATLRKRVIYEKKRGEATGGKEGSRGRERSACRGIPPAY